VCEPAEVREQRERDARRVLQRAGLRTGRLLGSGIEGTVADLGDGTVAKVWSGRTRAELEHLRDFYDVVHEARTGAVAMPHILDVRATDNMIITVEERLPGEPVWVADGTSPDLGNTHIDAMIEALAALSAVPGEPALRSLPILPDESPLDPVAPFETELAELVTRRVTRFYGSLRAGVPDLDTVLEATVAALHALQAATPTLVHGDLIAANVLASRNHATAVLDFGFLSTAGDPAFDAAIAASCFDMYGPHATEVEQELDRAFTSAFRHDPERLATFRAAYALITACCFGNDLSDGHFAWCVTMLGRPDVREAVRA
jgi:aminoglycoside phosphotransferase (APT) family kinase protein